MVTDTNPQVLVPIIPNNECITWHEDKNIMVQVRPLTVIIITSFCEFSQGQSPF